VITHKPKAGALLTGTEYEADDAHLEGVTTVAATGAAETLDASASSVYDLTLDQACTFTLTGATDGEATTITAILRGAHATTWPGSVTWLNGAPPTASLLVVTLFSVDGGTEWIGTTSRVTGPTYDVETYTAGDITITSTTVGVDLPAGPPDLVVPASAGDVLMIGLSARRNDADVDSLRMDVKCITGATENYVSSLTTTAATTGISGWFMNAGTANASGEILYIVQAADISSGNVTLSLRGWGSGTGTVLAAQTAAPLKFWVRNLGQ
jgi:hypothetical protein